MIDRDGTINGIDWLEDEAHQEMMQRMRERLNNMRELLDRKDEQALYNKIKSLDMCFEMFRKAMDCNAAEIAIRYCNIAFGMAQVNVCQGYIDDGTYNNICSALERRVEELKKQ